MNPTIQRIALAKFTDFIEDSDGLKLPDGTRLWDTRDWWCAKITHRHPDGRIASATVDQMTPDFLNDLNATFLVEEHLIKADLWDTYLHHLNIVTNSNRVHATAKQKCEAALLTINQWIP